MNMVVLRFIGFSLLFSTIGITVIGQKPASGNRFNCDVNGSASAGREAIDMLLRAAANEGDEKCVQEALKLAANADHPSVVKILMKAGVWSRGKDAELALYLASAAGHQEVVEELIRFHVDPNMKLSDGSSPLIAAAARGHQTVVSTLLQNGANVNARSENFLTALMAQKSAWPTQIKKIKIAESDRKTVEKFFDSPKVVSETDYSNVGPKGWGRIIKYETKSGKLEATFSTGTCTDSNRAIAYNIPSDAIVELIFRPNEPTSVNDLGFDMKNFEQEKVEDVVDSFVYHNRQTGIILEVHKGLIEAIELGLSKRQLLLACSTSLR